MEDPATKHRRDRDRGEPQQIRPRFDVHHLFHRLPHLVGLHSAETRQRSGIFFRQSVHQQLNLLHHRPDDHHLEQSEHPQICEAANENKNSDLQESFQQSFAGCFTHMIVGKSF